jgi:TonB family protein
MAEYRRRAAQMILAANPGGTYAGAVSEPAYGIVVVSIALGADGSIRNVSLLRRSSVGPDANDLAVQAVRRVGSFGPISNLAGPWDISETFFYNDARKFQLRTVVEKL